jgi:hypothetical protein
VCVTDRSSARVQVFDENAVSISSDRLAVDAAGP